MQDLTRRLSNALWIGDIGSLTLALAVASLYTHSAPPDGLREFLSVRFELATGLLLVAFVVCWHSIFRIQGLYQSRTRRRGAGWWEVTKAVVLGNGLLWAVLLLTEANVTTPAFLAVLFVSSFVGAQVLHGGLRMLFTREGWQRRGLKRVAIVGCGPRGAGLGKKLWQRPDLGYLLVGYVDDITTPQSPLHSGPERLLGSLIQLKAVIAAEAIDEVFIALPVKSHYDTIAKIMSLCEDCGVVVRMPVDVFERRLSKARIDYLDEATLLTFETPRPNSLDLLWKRSLDLVGSAVALVALAPVFVITAIAIKISSPGSVFFLQRRVGLRGGTFRIVKFRTMLSDAEDRQDELEARNEVSGAAFKVADDPRVTALGRQLRKFSVDELPQFLNVLRGDMSLVGPRPLPIRDIDRFDANWLSRRFSVKPGLTCLWQANGRHELGFRHWMELDLQYIDHWSLRLDWQIMAKTIPAVLRRDGAS